MYQQLPRICRMSCEPTPANVLRKRCALRAMIKLASGASDGKIWNCNSAFAKPLHIRRVVTDYTDTLSLGAALRLFYGRPTNFCFPIRSRRGRNHQDIAIRGFAQTAPGTPTESALIGKEVGGGPPGGPPPSVCPSVGAARLRVQVSLEKRYRPRPGIKGGYGIFTQCLVLEERVSHVGIDLELESLT